MNKYQMAFPYFPQDDVEDILLQFREILEGRAMLTMGRQVVAFEQEFAKYTGVKYAVVTNSCTSALEIVLTAMGVGDGDEVIVPVQTFIATGTAAAMAGARVVFCGTDDNFVLDVEDLKRRISPKTRAVIWVHFAGLAHPNVVEIRSFLKQRGIALIEDAAHAHGAMVHGVKAGALGDAACFSFFSTKIMTTGEGGMITTDNEELYKKCASLRDRGADVWGNSGQFCLKGSNRRMTEFQAVMGRSQLRRLEEFMVIRNTVAAVYKQRLASLEKKGVLRFQAVPDGCRHAYWRFSVFLYSDKMSLTVLQQKMAERGIPVDFPYSPLLHLQPAFVGKDQPDDFSATTSFWARHFCLPMHARITAADAAIIAQALAEELQ
jgi:perosamine synthetase